MKHLSNSKILGILVFCLILQSCKIFEGPGPKEDELAEPTAEALYKTGWLGDDNLAETPNNIRFGFASSTNLPSSFDNSKLMPPAKKPRAVWYLCILGIWLLCKNRY